MIDTVEWLFLIFAALAVFAAVVFAVLLARDDKPEPTMPALDLARARRESHALGFA